MSESENGVSVELKQLLDKYVTRRELESVNDDTTFDDLDLDSLDQVELIMDIEEHFEIDIPEERLDEANTFGKICALVNDIISENVV